MAEIKLLTSPTCPYCPKAREVLKKLTEKRKDVVVLELSVTTDEGMKEALRFGIKSVPAIIVNDEYVFVGVPALEELENVID
ncbi:thioredoxin family protein [Archaeoglobus veneficus]|uniref:Glutaredoxin n=1 Tax=Archaeoglobus veneficus (strain DSM 11195 / SNP6) TaxID=693661 RepID=F2KMX5_ARCVS|nr:thioredoxin family protein [Archaeoglobus veneficus]AEA47251.1 glutaredoxin [Archaeoglobus veneficus SNP6]